MIIDTKIKGKGIWKSCFNVISSTLGFNIYLIPVSGGLGSIESKATIKESYEKYEY